MLYQQNKKKETLQKVKELKPAWSDENTSKIQVNINKESRLRKLKATEEESTITGEEFAKRLKSQHEAIVGGTELFNWAQPVLESTADDTRK